MAGPHGLAVVDKPAGCTSHDVVAQLRRQLGTRKVGHAGTLDPDATGVLLVGVGRVTRLMRFATALPKTYTTTIELGTETDTLDASGVVTASHDMSDVAPSAVVAAAAGLTGDINQVPPMVSAVRVDGQRLHTLARQGIEVERQARPVTVHRFDVEPIDDGDVLGPGGCARRWRATVTCSSGTYVRVLAADLGAAVGGGAHLDDLRRTAVGPFTVEDARAPAGIGPGDLLPAVEALPWLPRVDVDAEVAALVANGRVLPTDVVGPRNGATLLQPLPEAWRVVGPDESLLAVYEPRGAHDAKPATVLTVSP